MSGQINLFKQDEIEKTQRKKKSFSEEKNLFGLTQQTEESVIRNDYKPKYFLTENDKYTEALITNVKITLLRAGLDKKAREFIDRCYKSLDTGTNQDNFKKIASDYVVLIVPTTIKKSRKK